MLYHYTDHAMIRTDERRRCFCCWPFFIVCDDDKTNPFSRIAFSNNNLHLAPPPPSPKRSKICSIHFPRKKYCLIFFAGFLRSDKSRAQVKPLHARELLLLPPLYRGPLIVDARRQKRRRKHLNSSVLEKKEDIHPRLWGCPENFIMQSTNWKQFKLWFRLTTSGLIWP